MQALAQSWICFGICAARRPIPNHFLPPHQPFLMKLLYTATNILRLIIDSCFVFEGAPLCTYVQQFAESPSHRNVRWEGLLEVIQAAMDEMKATLDYADCLVTPL